MRFKLLHFNFQVEQAGKRINVDVYESTRGGTMSPVSYYYRKREIMSLNEGGSYGTRYISQYEMKNRGYSFELFRIMLTESYISKTVMYGSIHFKGMYSSITKNLFT